MKKVFLGSLLLLGIFGLLVSLMMVGGCKSPLEPDPTPECQTNNTSQVSFQNVSNSNTTYDVIWDGIKKTTISPGTTSQYYTEAAGTHILLFKITNTNVGACTQSYPVLAQCHSYTYNCSR